MSNYTKSPAIGIDLGTTYSCVAVYINGKVDIIPNDVGKFITPSYIAFKNNGVKIGEKARYQAGQYPENTIYDVKRLIGRRYSEKVVQEDIKLWPFKVVPEDQDWPRVQITTAEGGTKTFTPEHISALLLKKLKSYAEAYLKTPVTEAVITVPAYFTDAQRQSTIDAGRLAGLEVIGIFNEPTAAAIAYGFKKWELSKQCVLVFDFGGGTLDVTILNIQRDFFNVHSTTGDTHLGGEDLDNRIVTYFSDQIRRRLQIDIKDDKKTMRRLKTECEKLKKQLSFQKQGYVEVDLLPKCNEIFYSVLTKATFEDICGGIFTKAMQTVEKALIDARMNKSDIDKIVLSGGSSIIPKVREMLTSFFNAKKLCEGINPDQAVAKGAAIYAALLTGAHDEHIRDIVVKDVTPMALGIQTYNGKMSAIIERAASLPVKRERNYTTSENNQKIVRICVYEGDNEYAEDNTFLDSFDLEGIQEAKAGVPQIVVTFSKDINGVLHVTALDETTNITHSITIIRRNT